MGGHCLSATSVSRREETGTALGVETGLSRTDDRRAAAAIGRFRLFAASLSDLRQGCSEQPGALAAGDSSAACERQSCGVSRGPAERA